ncbi:MAG: BMP family ABC transporter substrate-binding protein, partial [Candidatus Izemoplasmatales bacterium]|nr:BMP family ABC transporter substrate-binding protein [Candidatus Izemoplasmatales bacterium]
AILDAGVRNIEQYKNIQEFKLDRLETAYLAGCVAGLMTKTGKVGMVGGADMGVINEIIAGWQQGLRKTNPKVVDLVVYANSFSDPSKGKELGLSLASKGCDIIASAAGGTGVGAAQAAAEVGKPFVAWDVHYPDVLHGLELGSAVNYFEVMFRHYINSVRAGNYRPGTVRVYGIAERACDFEFTVVGFLDTEFDQLAYVSLGTTNPDLFTTNALFLKTTPTSEVEHELVTRYAPRMYYIVSMSDFMEDFTAQLLRATDMFLFFSVVIVFALAIVVVDQIVLIFDVERSAFAKRWILGESPKTRIIALGLESGVLVFMLLIIGSVEALGFAAWFPKMMMLFRYYKQITPDLVSIGIAYGIVVTMMVLMYTWYTRLTFRADIISNSKK